MRRSIVLFMTFCMLFTCVYSAFPWEKWDQATQVGVASGSDTEIQYNNSGDMSGDSNLTWTVASTQLAIKSKAGAAYPLIIREHGSSETVFAVEYGASDDGAILLNDASAGTVRIDSDGTTYLNGGGVHVGGDTSVNDNHLLVSGIYGQTASTDPDVDAAGEFSFDTDDHAMRGYDGTNQYVYGQKNKIIPFSITTPLDLDEADTLVIWHNKTGFTYNITDIYATSSTDDTTFTLKEVTDQTDFTALTTIEAVEVATNGTSVFTGVYTTGQIDHTAIEDDHLIVFDNDAADDPDYISCVIEGYFDGNVN